MTSEEKIALIKRYAPVFWMHEDDAFLPEDCAVMAELAEVGTSQEKLEGFKLDDLGSLKSSEKYFMDIPGVDFDNFGIESDYSGPEMGPEGVSDHLRQKFSNNTFLYPKARPSLPKYHARVSEVSLTDTGDSVSRAIRRAGAGVFGDYQVIQYFFFYLFNDAWNQHIGDWDATLEIFIKDDQSRAYAIFYMHYVSWAVNFSGKPQKLKPWIKAWEDVEGKKQMGWAFQYGVHPFVFVANGAHGGYPTPGFSVHGTKILSTKILGQTDYRKIGKLCIYPDYEPVKKSIIRDILKTAGVATSKVKFIPWEEPVVLENQPWLKYKGLWGTKSEYTGWSGPKGPAQKSTWRMDQRRIKRALAKAVGGDYLGEWPQKILLNWHGWR